MEIEALGWMIWSGSGRFRALFFLAGRRSVQPGRASRQAAETERTRSPSGSGDAKSYSGREGMIWTAAHAELAPCARTDPSDRAALGRGGEELPHPGMERAAG